MMRSRHFTRRKGPLAAAYFLFASLVAATTRFDGGYAWIWVSSAILIAGLLRRPTRRWRDSLLVCTFASALATGLFGLGWVAAVPLALVNMTEALVGAVLLRRWSPARQAFQSHSWTLRFVLALGIVAPLVAGSLAALLVPPPGMERAQAFLNYFLGHSLGNLAFTPVALLFSGRRARRKTLSRLKARAASLLLPSAATLAVCAYVFGTGDPRLLFAPALAVILSTILGHREGGAIAICILAVTGIVGTLAGLGAQGASGSEVAAQVLFFQFYLATTVLATLPVAAELEKRSAIFRRLRVSEERFRMLADHSTDVLLHLSPTGRIRFISSSIRQFGGIESAAVIGQRSTSLVAREDRELVRDSLRRVVEAKGEVLSYRYRAFDQSPDVTRWFESHSRALLDEQGRVEGILVIAREITEQVEREQVLVTAALTDPLTRLPNRRALLNFARRHSTGEDEASIAILDLDHFKRINDQFGHAAGDEILRGFAEAACRVVRQHDVVGRLGGEEFGIVFPRTARGQALQICERLRQEVARSTLSETFPEIRITVSGGVAGLSGRSVEDALSFADEALYEAKESGRDRLALAA